MDFKIINRFDKNRFQVEEFIKIKYQQIFNAKVEKFPGILVAIFDKNDVKAACGLRTELDGFFSQLYLSDDIEDIIHSYFPDSKKPKILEIVNLVSNSPLASLKMTKELNKFCLDKSYQYAFFTATKPLVKFLNHTGLDLIKIGKADINKVSNSSKWGSYYENDPQVFFARVPELTFSILFKNLRKNFTNVEFSKLSNQAL
jgi:hypothetical protein